MSQSNMSQTFKRCFNTVMRNYMIFGKIKEGAVLYCLILEVKRNDDTGKMHATQ